ncbi:hypothetical protein [Lignipirellula cremea]|uniref:Secreted protein n=1 Tax=Lignipirellula cremea TaxID=2528010 RepID=A0A518DZN3_9BACT|nr:hypothetical protein [Lignipirellula cremea]QDU97271.1 hypothetical protein Pla8534_51170 [Lignipirellula cremea]
MKSLIAPLACLLVVGMLGMAQATDHKRPTEAPKRPTESPKPYIIDGCNSAPCCVDAKAAFTPDARPCFTPQGIQAFIAIFSSAAEKGVENAAVRALNGTTTCPDCVPQEAKK